MTRKEQAANVLKELVSAVIEFIVIPIQQHELFTVVDEAFKAIPVEPCSLATATVSSAHIDFGLVARDICQGQELCSIVKIAQNITPRKICSMWNIPEMNVPSINIIPQPLFKVNHLWYNRINGRERG
jgi:hypothetical protein